MSVVRVNQIQDTSTNVAANISGGVVTFTNPPLGLPAATNTPAFQARRGSSFIFSDNTTTKVTGLTEDFDTYNNFASDRFTPTTAGKYLVTMTGSLEGVNSYDMYNGRIELQKNGSFYIYSGAQGGATSRSNRYALSISLIVDMNGSSLNNSGSANGSLGQIAFGAHKLIGV
jgi:hypothetical protein